MLSDLLEKKSIAPNAVPSSDNLPLDQMSQEAMKNFKNRMSGEDDEVSDGAGPDKHELKFHVELIDPKYLADDKKADSEDALFRKYMWNNVDAVNEVPDDHNPDLKSNHRFDELLPTEELDALIAEIDWDPSDLAEIGQQSFVQNSFGMRSMRTNPSAVYAAERKKADSASGIKIKPSIYNKLLQVSDKIKTMTSLDQQQIALQNLLNNVFGKHTTLALDTAGVIAKMLLELFGPTIMLAAEQTPGIVTIKNALKRAYYNFGVDNAFGTREKYEAPTSAGTM